MGLIKLWRDFFDLAIRQFRTCDFDAEHPLYRHLINKYGIDYESGLWLSFLYMAFYDEASAWTVFNNSEPFTVPKKYAYPIGTNRRNLFGGKIALHFASLASARALASDWPTHNFTGDVRRDWDILKENLAGVWGNGRFAVYTTSEMVQKVNGVKVEITGFDNRGSSGPADGIRRLFCCEDDVPTLDRFGEEAYTRLLSAKIKPYYTEVDRGVVESVLCNFSGVCRGRFYSGRNVDRQQDRIMRVEALGEDLAELWEARTRVFHRDYLGELNGWKGIDRDRLLTYKDTGRLPWSSEDR